MGISDIPVLVCSHVVSLIASNYLCSVSVGARKKHKKNKKNPNPMEVVQSGIPKLSTLRLGKSIESSDFGDYLDLDYEREREYHVFFKGSIYHLAPNSARAKLHFNTKVAASSCYGKKSRRQQR